MRTVKRVIDFAQVLAALSLGISFFLPFYRSSGLNQVRYADEWGLFF
jgi:hypothetical protein